MGEAIRTTYETIDERGFVRYHSQQSYASVERQILAVLDRVRNSEGTSAKDSMEWISFWRGSRLLQTREEIPFPKGSPLVAVRLGANEGWVIEILLRRTQGLTKPEYHIPVTIKFLHDSDLVFEAAKALTLAFEKGRYGHELPPDHDHSTNEMMAEPMDLQAGP